MEGVDVFGSPISDEVHDALLAHGLLDEAAAKPVLKAVHGVMQRQLSRYMDVNFMPEEHILAAHAPTHNMQAERILGMCDA